MARVVFDHVSKEYTRGAPPVVRDLSLAIEDRELVVVVGPSGCGKSTALRMIAGLEAITRGSLFIDAERMNDVAPKDRDVAMVFQSYALYPHMTCFENMAFALELRRVPRAEIARRVQEAARVLAIEPLLGRRPKELSGGQRQRVAIGRAIVREPRVFLMDEPLSNLDAKLRTTMRAELKRLHRTLGATIVYVTHDQTEAMTLGDRICVMRDGELLQMDTPEAIYERPASAFVATFIGVPPMNIVSGEIVGRPDALVGVRPEHLAIERERESESQSEAVEIEGDVQLIDWSGAEIFVHLATSFGTVIARSLDGERPALGSRLRALARERHLHFFDAATERRLPS